MLQVRAVDRDAEPNGVVSYRLESVPAEPDADRLVRVDRLTGVISAKVGFDRETLPRLVFDVVATDGGGDNPPSVTSFPVSMHSQPVSYTHLTLPTILRV